jgi:hypothetical protein
MVALGFPNSVPYASIFRTTVKPSVTFPKTIQKKAVSDPTCEKNETMYEL